MLFKNHLRNSSSSLVILFILATSLLTGCGKKKTMENIAESNDRFMKNLAQLTFDGDNGEAYFSWDSKKLIFQSDRKGYQCDKIWTMDIDGSNKQMVSPDHGAHTCSFFFPNGKEIVFASTSHLPGQCPPRPEVQPGHYVWPLLPYNIFRANLDGKNLKRITFNPEYDAEPIVSANGKKIVFGSKRKNDFDIYIMNSDGNNVKRLTSAIGYDGGPWFSPDGTKIAWRAWHPKTKEEHRQWQDCMKKNYIVPFPLDLWVMNADGTGKKRLTDNGATNWAPSWHPAGKRLIFASNMDDWKPELKKYGHNFELYLIYSDGSGLKRVTYNKVFDSFPMFSADGKKIVFASNRNPDKARATDIFIADWDEN